MLYTWGDTYDMTADGNILGTHFIHDPTNDTWPTFAFEFDLNQEGLNWQTIGLDHANDTTVYSQFIVRQLSNESVLTCGIIRHLTFDFAFQIGLLFTRYYSDGSDPQSIEIPFWNEVWQSIIPHQQVFPTDMIELGNGEILVAGVWADDFPQPARRRPFIMKFTSDLEFVSNFEVGNPEVDNWYPWIHLRDDGKIVFAYAHGLEWDDEVPTYANWDMRLGLFDPIAMDTLLVKSYPHQGLIQRLQDFEPTPDGGFIILGQGINQQSTEVEVYLLKVDADFEEEWFKTYYAPEFSWDITAHDIEITSDGGYAILNHWFDIDNEYYKPWLLKLDACGDLVWSGCPFVGVEESSMQEQEVKVWPNPFSSTIQLEVPFGTNKILIRDVLGNDVFVQRTTQTQIELSLPQLASGVYLMEAVNANGKVYSTKILKE